MGVTEAHQIPAKNGNAHTGVFCYAVCLPLDASSCVKCVYGKDAVDVLTAIGEPEEKMASNNELPGVNARLSKMDILTPIRR